MTTAIPLDAVELACEFGPLRLQTPLLAASGCFAYGQQFAAFTDLRALGGVSTKGISPLPRHGNPLPRICETAGGMLNSIGLENVGVESFLRDKLPFLRDLGVSVWVNFFGTDFPTYIDCAAQQSACDNDPTLSCLFFEFCIQGCLPGDDACFNDCASQEPVGAQLADTEPADHLELRPRRQVLRLRGEHHSPTEGREKLVGDHHLASFIIT